MSNVIRNHSDRMKASEEARSILQKALDTTTEAEVMSNCDDGGTCTCVGNASAEMLIILSRLLIEPRMEERLQWQNVIDLVVVLLLTQ